MSSKYGGYMGRVMKINLTTQEVSEYPWSDKQRALYLGGKIMAAKILYDNLTGNEKPFSEDNMLVITTGPLTCTGAPCSSRFNISTLSPQTGFITSSNCGGSFGFQLKKAGYDGLILQGRCAEHSWIEITETGVAFHNAEHLWGMKTGETQEALSKIDKKAGRIVIGPAGENLVKYSAILSQERVAGRGGTGAVMGWMNLKAVTAVGARSLYLDEQAKFKAHNKKWIEFLRKHPLTGEMLPKMGTAALVSPMNMRGILATRNYQYGQNKDFELVNGEILAEKFNIKNTGCLTCPIQCARNVEVEGKVVKGPELETLGLLGGGILNNSMENIIRWNYELDELGMDTISAASTLAFAMEANEKGLWDNGLAFGKTEGISKLWEDIAYRRGLGDELAEGSKRLSEKYGGREFAIHSKGLELAAYEPRGAVGQGLGYAVSNRGGCHLNGGYLVILEGLGLAMDPQTARAKADLTMMFQNLMEAISAGGNCLFTSYAFFPAPLIAHPNGWYTRAINKVLPYSGPVLRLMNKMPHRLVPIHLPIFHHTRAVQLVTGMTMSFGKYIRIGERGFDLERACNMKFGISAKDDTLPDRLTKVPQDPARPDTLVPLEKMKKDYYQARGWDQNGQPTAETLQKLEIMEA